ncbi:MAG: sporulation protein Cse60 [Bacilli bacterium]|nr:sporulation protein Cse60 [Bacilli bacterium]
MLQIEIISDFDEDELVEKVNYFLKQIDECLIQDIKYSQSVFHSSKENVFLYSVLIIYRCR